MTRRRTFLENCGALAALPWLPERLLAMDGSFDPWVEVHADNLRSNVREVARRVGSRPLQAIAIITTARTTAQHALDVAAGNSNTTHSKHVPASNVTCPECRGTKSHAIDLAPFAVWEQRGGNKINWNPCDPVTKELLPEWLLIGTLGQAQGLRWGANWKGLAAGIDYGAKPFDPGHLELPGA